jgi:putative MATE family efflux protein
LAWPVISENFLQTLLGIVDTIFVARLGAEALAGVGAAVQIMFFVFSILMATSVGSSVLVAQAIGARDSGRAGKISKQSLTWSVVLSIPLVLTGIFFAKPLIDIFGMEAHVTAIGVDYLQVMMGTVVVFSLSFLGGGVLRGAGNSRTPMLVTLIANVINIVLTYGLVFGELGMPEMGAVGSAWGTFYSRLIGFGILFWIMWRGFNGVSIRGRGDWLPQITTARQILKIGVPAAIEQLLNSVGFLVMSIVVAQLGTAAMAANRVAMNALSLSFLPGVGFGMAASALIGQSIGARKPDEGRAVSEIATQWAILWMSSLGVIFFFFSRNIVMFFTSDPAVIEIGAAGLQIMAFTQPFWAITIVQSNALRGTGNSQYPLRVGVTALWIAVLLGAVAIQYIDGGLGLLWGMFLVTSPFNALLQWRKFRSEIADPKLIPAFA